jgi:N-methylhydantoinase A/acetophenone carboxylase
VILGFIDPDYFLGGRVKLDGPMAYEAVRSKVAEPLGMTVDEAAWHIRHQIDGVMGQELYMRTALNSGTDPKEFTAFAVGGAGPAHAAGVSEFADIRRIALPPFAGAFGAFGTLTMDLVQTYEKGRKLIMRMPGADEFEAATVVALNEQIGELLGSAQRDIAEEGLDPAEISFVVEIQISYGMQRQTLDVTHPSLHIDSVADLAALFEQFEATYAENFGEGSTSPESGAEVRLVRLNVVGTSEKPSLSTYEIVDEAPVPMGSRSVLWDVERGREDTPVYRLDSLFPGAVIHGPALVEAEDSVSAVPLGWTYRLDEHLMGWMEKQS